MSSSSSPSENAAAGPSGTKVHEFPTLSPLLSAIPPPQQQQEDQTRKKRRQPGNPDPEAEVVALSPRELMAANRFVCEVCGKGFQRDQNLQLHRRGHNLPWRLKQRTNREIRKKVYVCPDPSCPHHHPARALGDLTGIKKHFSRKHGEKTLKCGKCSKMYAVESDWKAHLKTCGSRDYKCDCGHSFSRRDTFLSHRAFCDALAEETARLTSQAAGQRLSQSPPNPSTPFPFPNTPPPALGVPSTPYIPAPLSLSWNSNPVAPINKPEAPTLPTLSSLIPNDHFPQPSPSGPSFHSLMAVAHPSDNANAGTHMMGMGSGSHEHGGLGVGPMNALDDMNRPDYLGLGEAWNHGTWQRREGMTRDFLGLSGDQAAANMNDEDLFSLTAGTSLAPPRNLSLRPGFQPWE